jgi:hypothetical protein
VNAGWGAPEALLLALPALLGILGPPHLVDLGQEVLDIERLEHHADTHRVQVWLQILDQFHRGLQHHSVNAVYFMGYDARIFGALCGIFLLSVFETVGQ